MDEARTAGAHGRRVLVVDQRALAEAISRALDATGELAGADFADSGPDCLRAVGRDRPDVVVVGTPLQDVDPLALVERITAEHAGTTVVLFSGSAGSAVVERAVEVGASAVVAKWSPLSVLVDVLCGRRAGAPWVDPALAVPNPDGAVLTPREHDVLRLLGDGMAPQQIARTLGITLNTTRGHVKAVLAKLDSHSVLQAVLTAQQRGLL